MITAILVDDEKNCTDVLHWQLDTYCTEVNILCECNTPEDAFEKIRELKPDLVFLDIEMPRMNAFELLNALQPVTFDIIFTTAYNHFAVQAFKEKAIDYLVKPIEKNDLIEAVDRVVSKKEKRMSTEKMEQLLTMFREQLKANRKIALPTNEGISFIQVDEIIRVQSDNNYSFVFLRSGEKVCISKTLKQIEESLSGHPFFRVHQSHLVNLNHIVKFIKEGGGYLVMSDKSTITVARQRKEAFLEIFSNL